MDISASSIRTASKDIYHIILFILLVFALLFVFSLFTRCGSLPIPGWCELYWGILRYDNGGQPKVLIVYGDGGLGDHKLLASIIESPEHVGKRVATRYIDEVSLGNLKNYDLVIVEEARRMSTDKIKMFIDYANSGGKKLVWIGDAGTELYENDSAVSWSEYPGSDRNSDDAISPWIRKKGEDIISLEEVIGVRYIANYCDIKSCSDDELPWIGTFTAENRKHKLINGIRADLQMYGNFSIVQISETGSTTKVLDVDFSSDLIIKEDADINASVFTGSARTRNLGRIFPIIVTSTFGENVAYYAIPPEMLASDLMPKDEEGNIMRYYSLAEKLYYGMLY